MRRTPRRAVSRRMWVNGANCAFMLTRPAVENGSLMAGQSVGMVTKEQPAAEIIRELIDQAAAAIAARRSNAA